MGDWKLWGQFSDLIEVAPEIVCNLTRDLEDRVFDNFKHNMNTVNYTCPNVP